MTVFTVSFSAVSKQLIPQPESSTCRPIHRTLILRWARREGRFLQGGVQMSLHNCADSLNSRLCLPHAARPHYTYPPLTLS
jgi:hypothetical protein